MGKKKGNFFMGLLALSLVLGLLSGPVWADSSGVVTGKSASAKLDFKINIPTILYLQVGSAAAQDTVSCTLANTPSAGQYVPMLSNAEGANVTVIMRAVVKQGDLCNLTANSNGGLNSGLGSNIPSNKISWLGTKASGGGTITSTNFDNTTTQSVGSVTGPGETRGSFAFSYLNDTYYPADGDYTATVTYTLTAP